MDAHMICLKDIQDVNKSFVGYLTGWLDDPIYFFSALSSLHSIIG